MGILGDFVNQAVREKKSIKSLLPELQAKMTAQAEAAGYKVVTETK